VQSYVEWRKGQLKKCSSEECTFAMSHVLEVTIEAAETGTWPKISGHVLPAWQAWSELNAYAVCSTTQCLLRHAVCCNARGQPAPSACVWQCVALGW